MKLGLLVLVLSAGVAACGGRPRGGCDGLITVEPGNYFGGDPSSDFNVSMVITDGGQIIETFKRDGRVIETTYQITSRGRQ